MKVESFSVTNILGVEQLVVPTQGKHLILIGGKNGEGKSSAIAAFCMAICGKRGYEFPDICLKDGENAGSVEIILGDLDKSEFPDTTKLKVVRRFERGRGGAIHEKLEIFDESGEAAPEPQTILNNLYALKGLNPLRFDTMKKSEQRSNLLKAVGLDADLDRLNAETIKVFEERKEIGAKGKVAASAAAGVTISMPGVTHETQVVDVAALNASLDSATANSNQRTVLQDEVSESRKNLTGAVQNSTDITNSIDKQKKSLAALEAEYIASLNAVSVMETELARSEASLAGFQVIDASEIARKLRSASEVNAAVEQARRKKSYEDEADALRKSYDQKSTRLKAIETEKTQLVMGAQWPVDGVTVDEEGVLLNGIPIEQCSTAERIIVWAKVACALNPELKLIVINNGNDLDNDSLAAIDKFLEETGFQALVEFVTRTAEDEQRCCVVLEDGHSKIGV